MRISFQIIILFIGVLTLHMSCQRELDPSLEELEKVYYPFDIGHFVDYKVNKVQFSISGNRDTSVFYLRELNANTFINGENKEAIRIERLVKNNLQDNWVIDSIWQLIDNNTQVLKIENNKTFIKLSYPVDEEISWNGNAFNNLGENNYRYLLDIKSLSIDTNLFLEPIRVIQKVDTGIITYQDWREEYYVENIGLVKKIVEQFSKDADPLASTFGDTVSGIILLQEYIGHGKIE